MKKVKLALALLLIAAAIVSEAQSTDVTANQTVSPKLLAVVNTANWCTVCKVNGKRFAAKTMPYNAKGVVFYVNDLTNDTTIATAKTLLQNANLYGAVYTVKRKGPGKLMQSCGLIKEKKTSFTASGIVTFISPKTHRQLAQVSIAIPDEEMQQIIDNLLK